MTTRAHRSHRRALRIAVTVVAACERAILLKLADEWVYSTLLVAAFQARDVDKARELVTRVKRDAVTWKLESALADLTDAIELPPDAEAKTQLRALLDQLRAAVPSASNV